MARLPRLYAPNIPQLVQARLARPLAAAHEPTPIGALNQLHEWLHLEVKAHALALHGWVLLPSRIVLLATPNDPRVLPRIIQGLGRRMATRMMHGRVFDGRYRSTLVDDGWVLNSLAWLESLPTIEAIVDSPARWPWSSAQDHIGDRLDSGLLNDHPAYWHLDNTPFARQALYRQRLLNGLGEHDIQRIDRALTGQWALGDETFLARLRLQASRRVSPAPKGRPRAIRSAEASAVTN